MYTCASCGVISCCDSEHQKMPANCPMREQELMDEALAEYGAKGNKDFFLTSSEVESAGYCVWPRLRETVEFCKRMGYKKVGLAFCSGLRQEGKRINQILRSHGFEVVSAICKTGGISKEKVGIPEEFKIRPGNYEPMCNPIGQARLLNSQYTEFNIAVGLCVGHDSFFYKYSDAMVTTLIAKDRALAHNPVGAVHCYESYFKSKLDPQT